MGQQRDSESTPMDNRTTVEGKSDRELVVTRTFNGPVHIVYEAWTKSERFRRWWAPKSMGVPMLSCEMDVRTGGGYRIEFGDDSSEIWAFHGKYLEMIPYARLVWTNEESENAGVTTVTFEEQGDKTLLVLHELYPSKEALDEAIAGMADVMSEQFEQLDELLVTLSASTEGS